ncbi:MAG: VOC family protein [Candidatus Doudnabacteria bacterium]|nr:VOC family protein [Candidatus Doudnabacteria bacterium]
MKKITPHLWFDKEAKEAANFYASVFPDSKITYNSTLHETPTDTGDTDVVSFEISGQPFMAISAGPVFKLNPSISFFVNFDPAKDSSAKEHLTELWEKLSQGGTALMGLDKYPFSELYGWIQDKYGVSWQLMLTNPSGEERPFIIPSLLFTGAVAGRAEEAIKFYTSIFKDGKIGTLARYGKGMEPDKEGSLMFADFNIMSTWLAAMDSAHDHKFNFNEAISLLVPCESQEEIDYYWEKLSADPAAEQCGWLKDKFGVSWQVWPTAMGEMMSKGTPEQIARVTKAFMPMKKFNLEELQKAFDGK